MLDMRLLKVGKGELSVECRERIKRALCNKIREHGVELAKNGVKVYYKKMGEEKWRCPGVVIGRNGKTVMIKHGGLLRNVTKIHITRIQSGTEDTPEKEEVEEKRDVV